MATHTLTFLIWQLADLEQLELYQTSISGTMPPDVFSNFGTVITI